MSLAVRIQAESNWYGWGTRCRACGTRLDGPESFTLEIHIEQFRLCADCTAMLADQLDAIRPTTKEARNS